MIPKWWNLVIGLSGFSIQVMTFGIAGIIGLYNIEFLEHFEVDVAEVSLIGSINLGVFLGAGPFVSFLMNHMSHRRVAILGSLLSTISLLCIPFVDSIIYLYILYGVLAGLGFAMAYLPSSVLAGLYFNKHRSLASGIVTSGSGLGNIVFPFIGHTVISYYGWKGSMFILAGLMLQCVAFAALLFPLEVKVMKDKTLKVLDPQEELQLDKVNSRNGPVSMETVDQNDVEQSDKTDAGLNENEKMLPTSIENGIKTTKVNVDETENQSLKHCYVLCDFSFLVFFLNNIVWNMGAAIAWVLGPEYYVNMGLSKEDAAIIITFEGIGCFIGCIVGGGLGNIQRLSRLYMYIMWNIIIGVFTLVVPITIFQTVEALSFIMFVHGLGFGGILGLLVIFTVDLLGEKSLGDGFGYLMLSNGVGAIIGPPIGGVLKDSLGTYDVSFYLSGALIVVAGLAMFIIPVRNSFNDPKKVTEVVIEVMPSNSNHE